MQKEWLTRTRPIPGDTLKALWRRIKKSPAMLAVFVVACLALVLCLCLLARWAAKRHTAPPSRERVKREEKVGEQLASDVQDQGAVPSRELSDRPIEDPTSKERMENAETVRRQPSFDVQDHDAGSR